jgi:uncharacterized protein YuzE
MFRRHDAAEHLV